MWDIRTDCEQFMIKYILKLTTCQEKIYAWYMHWLKRYIDELHSKINNIYVMYNPMQYPWIEQDNIINNKV